MNEEWREHMRTIAKQGGAATAKKGSEYFKKIRALPRRKAQRPKKK